MKQRVVVQAIIQSEDKVLLLRRSQGRPGLIGKYELPGGSIDDNEQPDDALRRHLSNDVGIRDQELILHDVVSMTNRQDGSIQHILILYVVEEFTFHSALNLGNSYDEYQWKTMQQVQQLKLRDSASHLLSLYIHPPAEGTLKRENGKVDVSNTTGKAKDDHTIIYSDGGSRGNPGPSAAAFVIVNDQNEVIHEGGEYLGITTNNQAEYHGVRLGLERAIAEGLKTVEFRIDSMLVVNQLKGLYAIKNRELWPINERITALLPQFEKLRFVHVPRERNTLADSLVNKLLNEHQNDQE